MVTLFNNGFKTCKHWMKKFSCIVLLDTKSCACFAALFAYFIHLWLNGFKWGKFFTIAKILFCHLQQSKSCKFSCCINPSLFHWMSLFKSYIIFLWETIRERIPTFITSSTTLIYIICYHHTLTAYISGEKYIFGVGWKELSDNE